MEKVTQLITRLQQICTTLGETAMSQNAVLWNKLSTIVVVGGQSSGKSSVLEAVVGRDFLPRGTGIVTRRPLVLQLVKEDDPNAQEWGVFGHNPDKRWFNFEEIRGEIEVETERHLQKHGNGRVVSPDPIYLTVHSPHVPNLTMVDMPGLTKVPIDGQPASIVQELEDMARMYVKGENAIILAVTPANADLATSDALRMAREVDPTGERTIGVLTKVDIMDRGTDCRDVLMGRSLRLRHGWVAVVNRGQADINSKVSMKEARAREREFFSSTPAYADLTNIGTGYLADKLSNHLINEIMKNLPSISQYIDQNISRLEKELKALGGDLNYGRGSMLHLILTLCHKLEKAFAKLVDGGRDGGERILDVFEIKLKDAIQKLPFQKILTLKNVQNVVNEADGYQPHIIAPENGYRRLIEDGLALLRDPAFQAIEQVHQILKNIVTMAINHPDCRDLARFFNLKAEMVANAAGTLDKLRKEADLMVRTLVDMEASYLSASFFREIVAAESYAYDPSRPKPAFVTLNGELLFEKRYDTLPPSDAHLQRIADHVSAYLQIVRSQLLATVPKAIVHCMVMPSKESLLAEFQEDVAGKEEPQLRRLINESEEIAEQRDGIKKRLTLLLRAAKEIAAFM
uniref:Dynamin GTPase n=1 Tax=Chlamydomonas leiostraca TaxID=1034604 RepID=A0A7S0WQS1_9CHLO|mmetsp:Transcript_2395/g.6040  ORF Transcript_2395/g.6040 Transcript_2395/m.6040 type:complete len:629 (+) Transcript_2395:260-2146(+)|eukprot:CAMPEP_0202866298 /NCGR_PEP_ID=MMETSP1391-20130828/7306_1 /ASSEMBLY_ACC=CAM_ASM_000867 /TAXON_ID=1034604 /ORGANISM="Chlamydomonas leiostraca, Strain SAG 11-49" /LENGTH=628 /DNA_ID=CAMNT_0049546231 /DNA_START=246 /DNA_END=2132 /DNA_ORIENTATION=+